MTNLDLIALKDRLEKELKAVETQISDLSAQDPFSDTGRLNDNAASDTEANEEMDHERFEAIIGELKKKKESLDEALKRVAQGTYGKCVSCGNPIDIARLTAVPTALYCMNCENKRK